MHPREILGLEGEEERLLHPPESQLLFDMACIKPPELVRERRIPAVVEPVTWETEGNFLRNLQNVRGVHRAVQNARTGTCLLPPADGILTNASLGVGFDPACRCIL